MKTFLHYTKERELDESSRIAGALGSLVRIGDKINTGAGWFKQNIAPAFQAGAKPGSLLGAGGTIVSGLSGAAEKEREKQFAQSQRFVSAKRRSLGKNHPKVKDFDTQEADILDPQNTTFRDDDAREAALRKHYTDFAW
jgi:hypothetical protein